MHRPRYTSGHRVGGSVSPACRALRVAVLPALPERALRGDAGDRNGAIDDAAIAGATVMLRGASMFLFHPQADGSFVVQGGARFMPAKSSVRGFHDPLVDSDSVFPGADLASARPAADWLDNDKRLTGVQVRLQSP